MPFYLLSDSNRDVSDAYGVPLHLGMFPSKSSFVIGPDNTIHHVYDWLFKPRKHIVVILSALAKNAMNEMDWDQILSDAGLTKVDAIKVLSKNLI